MKKPKKLTDRQLAEKMYEAWKDKYAAPALAAYAIAAFADDPEYGLEVLHLAKDVATLQFMSTSKHAVELKRHLNEQFPATDGKLQQAIDDAVAEAVAPLVQALLLLRHSGNGDNFLDVNERVEKALALAKEQGWLK